MDIGDVKLYLINLATMLISITDIEAILKILLLIVTIGYTAYKWYFIVDKNKNEKNK